MSGMSSTEGKSETLVWIVKNNIKTILDIGAGSGTYHNLLESNGIRLDKFDAVEVWQPYVEQYSLKDRYDHVFQVDARKHNKFDYDLVILGDVLEHMTKEEAIALWTKISKKAKHAIISIPIIHYPQGHIDGNPYEEHVKEDWTTEEVLETFKGIVSHQAFSTVGVFYATFRV
jgi:SAM-dependent methyltransferase